MSYKLLSGLVLLILGSCSLAQAAERVRVAVASNFLLPLKSIAKDYQQQTGDRLRISSGSTGKLYAQIVNGAPYDVFLAANAREPERLEREGHAVPGSRFSYALGRLAVWVPGIQAAAGDWVALLESSREVRLSLANPAIAPYGAAAREVLEKLDILKDLAPAQMIRGENVSQAYQQVASGATDMGFVALAQLKARGDDRHGRYWLIDGKRHSPIRQQAVLLTRAKANAAAKRFLAYLSSQVGRAAIRSFGYELEARP